MAFWKSGGISLFIKNTNGEPMSVPMNGMVRDQGEDYCSLHNVLNFEQS